VVYGTSSAHAAVEVIGRSEEWISLLRCRLRKLTLRTANLFFRNSIGTYDRIGITLIELSLWNRSPERRARDWTILDDPELGVRIDTYSFGKVIEEVFQLVCRADLAPA
jgi:hypothetical protein